MLFAISYDQTSKIDKRIIMKKIKSLLIKKFSFFRKVTLVLYVLVVSFNGMIGQSGYSSVRHYYGMEPFANEALMSQSCRIQNTVKKAMINPTDEFNVFGYDYEDGYDIRVQFRHIVQINQLTFFVIVLSLH